VASKLRESVSAIFRSRETGKIFTIKRQNYLSVFPGYTAFPGGKVDPEDTQLSDKSREKPPFALSGTHWQALSREMEEEIGFSLIENLSLIKDIFLFGKAITPEFNPYRFKAHFFIVEVEKEIDFKVDTGEAVESGWFSCEELLSFYERNALMAVPPIVFMIQKLCQKDLPQGEQDLTLPHIVGREVPMIESLYGVKQFLPLSNTFPPANRTNCFIIGDEPLRLLVDPSPKDEDELEKLCRSLGKIGFDAFFISHHHSDHHEYLPLMHTRYPLPVYMSEVTHQFIIKKWGRDYLKGMDIHFLKEGDSIGSSLGRRLMVYEVPGHDEGQLALAPDDMSWFFVGDLIQTIGTVVIGGDEGDMIKYFESLNKVIKLNPKFIIPSHGIALGGVHKLKMTLKHRLHREEQIIELLREGADEEKLLNVIYEGLEERLIPYARKTITAHLNKIRTERSS
jgi:ribonuclease/clavin/mitogillin